MREVKDISIKEDTLKLKYDIKEALNLDNLILNVSYTDGTFEEITSGYFSSLKNGSILEKNNNRIIFKYGGKEVTANIVVGEEKANKDNKFNYNLIFIPVFIVIVIIVLIFVVKPKSYY